MATAVQLVDAEPPSAAIIRLAQIVQARDGLADLLTEDQLSTIGYDVVQDYERDVGNRKDWEDKARNALKRAAQEKVELKNPPPYRHSHIDFPILTVAAQQFNARAYPAICKTGNIVRVKVVGSDTGRPAMTNDGQPIVNLAGRELPAGQAQALMQQAAQQGIQDIPQPQQVWLIAPGAKQQRADRVSDYMNTYVEFRLEGWEIDTDALLMQIPIIGCGFRKVWWRDQGRTAYISALDFVVPQSAKDLKTTPRSTEVMRDVYPYLIRQRIRAGTYRDVTLNPTGEDTEEPRTLLEQHRYLDLDEDGLDEPYIITVDQETAQVLRIEPNFTEDDVHLSDDGTQIVSIDKEQFYIKYPFLPDPKGGFYDIGFGHLVEQVGDVINVAINQMLDAGHAQIAGGGFIAAGLRLQSNTRGDRLTWQPGEYKTVNVSGGDLRNGIYERTFPEPSAILYNLLNLMLGAAKDITSVKDIVTGDAPNTAPVGTTLALIEQGLQVFTAIYKRVYRSLGDEFMMLFRNLSRYGGDEAAEDYMAVLDDPQADFAKDFADGDMDIKPVADPTAVTSAQRIAKAQILQSMQGQGLNDMEIKRRILEAAGIENIEALMPPENAPPDPAVLSKLALEASQTKLNNARADQAAANTTKTAVDVGKSLGEADDDSGRMAGVAGIPGDAVGDSGAGGSGQASAGSVGAGVVGAGGF